MRKQGLDKENRARDVFPGLEHAGIAAVDPERLARWYVETFSLAVIPVGHSSGCFFLRGREGSMLEIFPASSGVAADCAPGLAGLRHLAMAVADFDKAVELLKERGVSGFFQWRRSDESKMVFFRDPEGNVLHLVWRADPPGLLAQT